MRARHGERAGTLGRPSRCLGKAHAGGTRAQRIRSEAQGIRSERKAQQRTHPGGRILELAKVGLKLASEHVQRRRLADTVGAQQPQHVARPWRREAMEFEGVEAIPVSAVGLQVGRQVNNAHGVSWAMLCSIQTRQACLLKDLALVALHGDALLAAGARILLQEGEGWHVGLALLLIKEQHALLLPTGLIGLTAEALAHG